jgi:hypothetical protein
MELVYKLNIPPLDQVLREDRVSMLDVATDHPRYVSQHPSTVLKTEWLNFNGIEWDIALYFFKPPGFVGRVHTDVINPDLHIWGINWIYGASGALNFWDPKNIQPFEKKIDEQGYPIWNYPTNIPPDKSYHMEPGAYLTNVRFPHQPVSHGVRHCISLRCGAEYCTPWEQAVEMFRDYIECAATDILIK